MNAYIARRLALVVPTVFLVALMVFTLVRLLPGDAVVIMLSEANVSDADIKEMRTRLGLDKPIHEQFLAWSGDILHGDLGASIYTRKPVFEEVLVERLPVTLELTFLAVLFSLVIGIPIGVLSAVRQDTLADYIARSIAILGLSMPYFWTATLIILYGALWFQWMPPIRFVKLNVDPLANISFLLTPALLLAVYMAASVMRMTRTTLLEVLRHDYIRTARAKGLREQLVIWRHAMQNAMGPVIVIIGVNVVVVLGGTIILEQIFGIPGVGTYTIKAVLWRDYPAIQAVNLFVALAVVLVNLAVDLVVAYSDPRIRQG